MPTKLHNYLSAWCEDHGWTDLFLERYQFWAFPPGGVLPMPLPSDVFEDFQSQQQWSRKAIACYVLAIGSTLLGIGWTFQSSCPMPLIMAFAVAAIAVAMLED
jgi:uncharacterized membrane protein YedE/YeeE